MPQETEPQRLGSVESFAEQRGLELTAPETLRFYSEALSLQRRYTAASLGVDVDLLHYGVEVPHHSTEEPTEIP